MCDLLFFLAVIVSPDKRFFRRLSVVVVDMEGTIKEFLLEHRRFPLRV